MKYKVLITGGMGNLGSWLVRHFVDCGHDVVVLSRSAKNYNKKDGYKLIVADITKIETLAVLTSYGFDCCIHTASYNEYFEDGYPKKALEINTLGTRNLVEVLLRSGRNMEKFIYFSTFHIYGKASGFVDENTELTPTNDYALTHLFAEYYLKRFYKTNNLNYCTLRLTNSYGAPIFKDSTKWYLVLNDFAKMAFEHQVITIKSDGLDVRDFIWMGDVCNITEAILSNQVPCGEYNLASGQIYKIIDIAKMVADCYKDRYGAVVKIDKAISNRVDVESLSISADKLSSFIKFNPKNMFFSEIDKIFDILESDVGKQ